LCKSGRRYIIGVPKSDLKKFASELADRDGWRAVRVNAMRCDPEPKPRIAADSWPRLQAAVLWGR
jgi:hypothetical protein